MCIEQIASSAAAIAFSFAWLGSLPTHAVIAAAEGISGFVAPFILVFWVSWSWFLLWRLEQAKVLAKILQSQRDELARNWQRSERELHQKTRQFQDEEDQADWWKS